MRMKGTKPLITLAFLLAAGAFRQSHSKARRAAGPGTVAGVL